MRKQPTLEQMKFIKWINKLKLNLTHDERNAIRHILNNEGYFIPPSTSKFRQGIRQRILNKLRERYLSEYKLVNK